jgi:hypothetical protein
MNHKSHKTITLLISAGVGFLWAYSFITRIGLFFLIPLWLKALVLTAMWVNCSLLAYFLGKRLLHRYGGGPAWVWLLAGSAILAGAVFLLAPYQRLPFQTTHTLKITSGQQPVEIFAVFSQDENLIPREAFSSSGEVVPLGEAGFRLSPGASLQYQRAQIGGITLSFIAGSGRVTLTWDSTTREIPLNPSTAPSDPGADWRLNHNLKSDRVRLQLPGNTWGDPDPLWALLGILMPVADFIALTSLIAGLTWLGLKIRREKRALVLDWQSVKAWLALGLTCWVSVLLFKARVPNFIPWLFLAMFLPVIVNLTIQQATLLKNSLGVRLPLINPAGKFLDRLQKTLRRIDQNPWALAISLTILAGVAAGLQLHLTQPGMGISGDSIHYLQGAENIVAGLGYVRHIKAADPVPITGFPPLYSFILSVGVRTGLEPPAAARYLNTFLLMVTVALSGWLVFRATRSTLASLLAPALMLLYAPILEIYSWVMTEPLFITFSLVIISLWLWYLRRPTLWKALLIGAVGGLATLTRLVGVAILAALGLGTVIFHKGKPLRRWLEAILIGLTGILPLAAFFYRNSQITGALSEARDFHLAPFKEAYVKILASELGRWFRWDSFFSEPRRIYIAVIITLTVIFGLFLAWRFLRRQEKKKTTTTRLVYLILILLVMYCLTLVGNVVILAPDQTEYGLTRYMLPLFVIVIIWLAVTLKAGIWRRRKLMNNTAILLFVVLLFTLHGTEAGKFLQDPPWMFREYTDKKAACQEEAGVFDHLPEENAIYTNNCEFFFFLSGQRCLHLSMTTEDFQPGGEIYQDVQNGDVIAYSGTSGFEPPGIAPFLESLELYQTGCYFQFYRWPE